MSFRPIPPFGESETAAQLRRLQQAEKMEALGRLAGGVAHDFNNILTVISGYTEMLQDGLASDAGREKLASYIDELKAAGTRAVHLTDQLLAFSGRKMSRPRAVNLNEEVARLRPRLQDVLGSRISLTVDFSPGEPCIQADPAQLEYVLVAVAENAREVMLASGEFTIRIRTELNARMGTPGQDVVIVELADSGSGISPEKLPHIFEPFFPGQSNRDSTGLGLPAIYGIIKQIGGEIKVRNATGAGTTFELVFPCAKSSREKASGPPLSNPIDLKGHETILIVEDDSDVRTIVQTALERFGYTTLVASDGESALDLFQKHRKNIALLLTDILMPVMSGRELAAELLRVEPGLKVVYMSGFTADEIAVQGTPESAMPPLIYKPFQAEQLALQVRQALNAR